MRLSLFAAAGLVLLTSDAAAQEWIEYTSKQDLFIVNFPGEPSIREAPYPTEFGITLSSRVYTVESQGSRYSVTVVDYRNVEQLHTVRGGSCQGNPCTNRIANDVRGALDYAMFQFMHRPNVQVTYYGLGDTDRIEGRRIQLLNPDKSLTFGAVYMHELRLYILEGTVPPNAPPPALFQQNVGIFDEKMERVRYRSLYRHGVTPLPEREPSPPGGRERGC